MEIQLQELIDQIKKDGVEVAESEANSIIDAANAKAAEIIAEAQNKAEKIMLDAKKENEKIVKASEDAIRQAGRNLLISFRESVARELNAIVNKEVAAVYTSDKMAELIISAVENWAKNSETDDVSVILNSSDLEKMEETLLSGLKAKMIEGVTLKANDNFDGGFRIASEGSGAYFDYSAKAVVDMLSNYLSPRVTELLKEAE